MARHPATTLHQVYLVEQLGDTLVVIPRGDAAGFSTAAVNTEMQVILTLVESGATQHLVIDLSVGNYLGSVVLGALVQLGNKVKNRGGRIAMAAPSNDMQDILRLMKLDQMWEMFHSRSAAIRSIARVPLKDRLWARRRWLSAVGAIGVGVLLYRYMPRPRYGRAEYRVVNQLWQELEQQRSSATQADWLALHESTREKLKPIIADLEARSKARNLRDAEPFVLYIARDYWASTLNRYTSDDDHSSGRKLIQFYLRCAEAALEGRPLPVRFSKTVSDSTTVTNSSTASDSSPDSPPD